METKSNTTPQRVSKEFIELISELKNRFEEENGVEISFPQATKIITIKIKKAGGLK